jgi:radical SAM protein with 4Fe4S-binding SPASM domain
MSFIPVALPFDTTEAEPLAERWFSTLPEYRYSETAMGWTVTKGPWRRWFSWVPRYKNLGNDMHAARNAPPQRSKRCFYLYRSVTVNPGGGVAPCCVIYDQSQDTGNIGQGLDALWNNDIYRSMRAEFHPREAPQHTTVCSNCHIFNKQPKPRDAAVPEYLAPGAAPIVAGEASRVIRLRNLADEANGTSRADDELEPVGGKRQQ